jgi:hypothetical protein
MGEPIFPNVILYLNGLVVGFMIFFLQDQKGALATTPKGLIDQQLEFRNAVYSGNVGNLLIQKMNGKMSEDDLLLKGGVTIGFCFCIYELVSDEIFKVATFEQYNKFKNEAKFGDIDYLLKLCRKWVQVR